LNSARKRADRVKCS